MNKRVFSGATCTKPTVSNGSIQPDSATIADGAQYTVTCNNDFAISGDAQVTCTNGVLSAAPTCSDTSAGWDYISYFLLIFLPVSLQHFFYGVLDI